MTEQACNLQLSCVLTGSLCQEVINHCDPDPCQNGGRCEGRAGGYSCSCLPGYAGPLCAAPTTFSFERSGYLLLQGPLVDAGAHCNVTLSFRSVLPRAMLFQRNSRGSRLSLELDKGRLRLTLRKESSAGAEADGLSQVLELPHNVTDGEWHSVETVLRNRVFTLKLLDDSASCARQPCHKAVPVRSTPESEASPPQNTFFGGELQHSVGPNQEAPVPSFIGCMRDVFVDRQLVIPEDWLKTSVNVSPGCSHRDRCLDVPCKNGGQCVNLWQSYRCRCPRPYEGQDCEEGMTDTNAEFPNEMFLILDHQEKQTPESDVV